MSRSRLALSFGQRLDLDLRVGDEAPSSAQALVVPQDVNLILGEEEPLLDPPGTPQEAASEAAGFTPRRPGSVRVVRGPRGPLLFQAIVYDFDRVPVCREEHVFEAVLTAFEEARARGLACLALRPLGTAHAGLAPELFLRLLAQVCYSAAELGTSVRRVHLLLTSPGELERYEALLRGLTAKG